MTNSRPHVAVLHPGQMGAAIAGQLSGRGTPTLWCPTGRSEASVTRAASARLQPVADLAELLDRADIVLSICPPAAAEDLASEVAKHRYAGIFVDANAISPDRAARIGVRTTESGARFVDGAIIGPPPRTGKTARLYLSGPEAATVAELFEQTSVEPVLLDGTVGTASGLKMAYASYQKATRALAGVAHALAADLGVTEHLVAEAVRNPNSPLADPDYLPSVAARAWRWAPEMREIADTLTEAGLPPYLGAAATVVLERWRDDKDTDLPLESVLDHLHLHET
jgi:3-hydroxyisobutyrate dehydrogenase-like beta-hydroxyacid dehydrogenase